MHSSMALILKCSKYYSVSFLLEWIEVQDLMKLETSLNKQERKLFFALVQEFLLKFEPVLASLEVELSLGFMESMLNKGIKLKKAIIGPSLLKNLNFYCPTVPLILSLWFKPKLDLPDSILVQLENLKSIHLHSICSNNIEMVELLLQWCPNVDDIAVYSNHSIDDILSIIAATYPKLRRLSIAGHVKNVNLSIATRLLHSCTVLEDFKFNTFTTTNNINEAEAQSFFALLLTKCPSLLKLNIAPFNCRLLSQTLMTSLLSLKCRFHSDQDFRIFLNNGGGTKLQELDISESTRLTDEKTTSIGASCPNLISLKLYIGMCSPAATDILLSYLPGVITFHAIDPLRNYKPHLLYSHISESLLQHCPLLVDIDLRCCPTSVPYTFRHLKCLRLECIPDITTLNVLLSSVHQLTSLTLVASQSLHLSNVSIPLVNEVIGSHCSSLRVLLLHEWYFTEQADLGLIRHLPQLETLGLSIGSASEVATEFLIRCTKIRRLFLRSKSLTCEQWDTIIAQCDKLIELEIYTYFSVLDTNRSAKWSPQVLRSLLMKCPKLKKLDVRGGDCDVLFPRQFEAELQSLRPECFISLPWMTKNVPFM